MQYTPPAAAADPTAPFTISAGSRSDAEYQITTGSDTIFFTAAGNYKGERGNNLNLSVFVDASVETLSWTQQGENLDGPNAVILVPAGTSVADFIAWVETAPAPLSDDNSLGLGLADMFVVASGNDGLSDMAGTPGAPDDLVSLEGGNSLFQWQFDPQGDLILIVDGDIALIIGPSDLVTVGASIQAGGEPSSKIDWNGITFENFTS